MRPEAAPPAGSPTPHLDALPQAARDRLGRFVALLRRWQTTHNLVSARTLDDIWTRHVEDSLQLLAHAGDFRTWVDLGSGAGFPGLVAAIAVADPVGRRFVLVEANQKKAAFLRAAARECGAPADVAAERAESHAGKMAGEADVVSARALAPLDALCRLALPYLHGGSRLLLLKGQDFVHEVEDASKSWCFDMVTFNSVTDPSGCVAVIRNLAPRDPSA